jgi:hypothetical protein
MDFLKKIFRSKAPKPEVGAQPVACRHVVLVPHWDNVTDMGVEARATSFICDACQASFTPSEANMLRRTEVDRLNEIEGGAKAE